MSTKPLSLLVPALLLAAGCVKPESAPPAQNAGTPAAAAPSAAPAPAAA